MGIFDRFAKRSASGSDASRPAQRAATTLRALTPEEKAQLEARIDELTELGLVDSPVALDLWFLANKPAAAEGTTTLDVVEKTALAAAYIVRQRSYYDFAMFGEELVLAASAEGIALPGLRPAATIQLMLQAQDVLPSSWIRGAIFISNHPGVPEQECFLSGERIASQPTQAESDELGVGVVEARDAGFDTDIDALAAEIAGVTDAEVFIRMLTGHIFGKLRREYAAKFFMASSAYGREYATIVGEFAVAPRVVATAMLATRESVAISTQLTELFANLKEQS